MKRGKNPEFAFSLARQMAAQSDFTKTHVGCLITYKGKPVASGCNTNKTHPIQKKYNRYRNQKELPTEFIPKMHAEIQAIAKLRQDGLDPRKLTVYIYRIRKDQSFGMARPCPSCMQAIKDLGIKDICYTTNTGYACEKIYEF